MSIVSFVVRGHGDPAALDRTSKSLRLQRDVDVDVAVVEQGESRSRVEAALRAATGTYVAMCDAGDEFFPEHASTLVEALERSGKAVAYAQALVAFVDGPSGNTASYALVDRAPVTPYALRRCDTFVAGAARTLIRREVLEDAGWLGRVPALATDYELWLRLLKSVDFARVERVTVIHPCVLEGTAAGIQTAVDTRYEEALRAVDALHPLTSGRRSAPAKPEPAWLFPR